MRAVNSSCRMKLPELLIRVSRNRVSGKNNFGKVRTVWVKKEKNNNEDESTTDKS